MFSVLSLPQNPHPLHLTASAFIEQKLYSGLRDLFECSVLPDLPWWIWGWRCAATCHLDVGTSQTKTNFIRARLNYDCSLRHVTVVRSFLIRLGVKDIGIPFRLPTKGGDPLGNHKGVLPRDIQVHTGINGVGRSGWLKRS